MDSMNVICNAKYYILLCDLSYNTFSSILIYYMRDLYFYNCMISTYVNVFVTFVA